ncbi:MAG: aminomethyl-transferring glycine dehydrogenase subunit GcvPB [Candidatus Binatus sp.]|uniref:aminomethyl-transferring glycine dehydrogenase subunit GcvPB n=1 Tax=Candidatus Binatus sp. TaxID=2811406 RepID=UPI0027182906|nr:aminomethyl-transferring glycine dehydrogenase subunit GcvPB [Candidatus Binatus sp.]MDO8431717.1 aminomethyl-transferring glycine dehydrogenase subunit GcvPB [Candidatus Binatus sp.]
MASAGRISKIAPIEKAPAATGLEPTAGVPLIFELSSEGRRGADVSPKALGARRGADILGAELCRQQLDGFPELSEPQVLRHFLRLSQLNFAQAIQFYPLGSCTMKYNPLLNDEMASLPGFAGLHPATPAHLAQGALELIARMEAALAEITGMDAVSLHPAAGAQGELTGLLLIRAYHRKRGETRHKVIIPDTAHGTNPASCTLAGFEVVVAKSSSRGYLEAAEVRRLLSDDVAAMMVTNPNTLGIFEPQIQEIAAALHERGAMLYLDGANMNALLGVAKPGHMGADLVQLNLHKTFSTPHGGGGPGAGPVAVKQHLEPFLPMPRIKQTASGYQFDTERPDSIGRLRSFHNNFGMIVRAYAYILALGGDGLAMTSRLAILGANYVRKRLEGHFPSATAEPSMHECVLSHDLEKRADVSTLEIAKRLLDFGIHPPTIYFPLVVPGALMIEPTETESKEILDNFVSVMERIYDEALQDPASVKNAPQTTAVSRVDEAEAARRPILRWTPKRE